MNVPEVVRLQRKYIAYLLLIFFLALGVRLAVVSKFSRFPVKDQFWNDAVGWNLAQGRGFTASQGEPRVPGLFRSPGYPAFLAAIYKVAGHSFRAVYAAQSVLDSATAVLIACTGLIVAGPLIGIAAGGLYALYPYPAMFCGVLTQDILLTFTLAVCLLLVVMTRGDVSRMQRWVALGVAIGILALVKPFLILWAAVPAIVACFAKAPLVRKTMAVAVMSFAIALTITPWVVRNYVQFHAFPPLAVGGGEGMRALVWEMDAGEQGNVQHMANMKDLVLDKYDPKVQAEYLAQLPDGAELLQFEKQQLAAIGPVLAQRWPDYARVMLRHVWRNWLTLNAVGSSGRLLQLAMLLSFAVLFAGLAGMIALSPRWRELLPLYATVLGISVFYAPYPQEARYTLPARPAMMVFIAGFIAALISAALRRRIPTAIFVKAGASAPSAAVPELAANSNRR